MERFSNAVLKKSGLQAVIDATGARIAFSRNAFDCIENMVPMGSHRCKAYS